MRNHAIHWYFALTVGFLLGEPANAGALTTTYVWENPPIGANCIDDPSFAAEFPELCIDETAGVLSVAFVHDEPIWDNDAHGCHPLISQEGCDVTVFDRILRITLSGVAIFDESEILFFEHIDFLGRCPAESCESAPPIIGYHAIDVLTGLEIGGGGDGALSVVQLAFPDGRFFITSFAGWSRHTMPAPGTLGLFGVGLLGLGLTRRKAWRASTQCRRDRHQHRHSSPQIRIRSRSSV